MYEVEDQQPKPYIQVKKEKKEAYLDFLKGFKEHLVDFLDETTYPTLGKEFLVTDKPLCFIDEIEKGHCYLKNQGENQIFITTDKKSGFRIDPGEMIKIYIHTPFWVVAPAGSSSLGVLRA